MIHVGDITKLSGYTLPVVDIITGGSPCQDLSVAGKRAGLDGERSGLFMEQIRIVKEMRERDSRTGRTGWLIRPRFMVWENVPGAFSSNKGKDFQAVLSEIVKIAEPDAPDVPMPEGGRWSKSGCLYSDVGAWSVAWRVHDAQFWGVPQRRKRIALVADFGGLAAPEILFEREGLSGDFEPCGEAGQEAARAAGNSVEGASCYGLDHVMLSGGTTYQGRGYYNNVSGCLKTQPHGVCDTISFQERAGKPGGGKGILIQNERVGALSTLNNQSVCYGISSYASNAMLSDNPHSGIYEADTARTLDLNGGSPACNQGGMAVVSFKAGQGSKAGGIGAQEECAPTPSAVASGTNQVPAVYDARGNGDGEIDPTMTGDHQNRVTDYTAIAVESTNIFGDEVSPTLNTAQGGQRQPCVVDTYQETVGALCAGISKQVGNQIVGQDQIVTSNAIVRRLSPKECERLQGFPDDWTNIGDWVDSKGKKHKSADSPRYKALGNSIALPFWAWMARRICAQYERPMTTGSLFDGIGGFPLVFERAGAKAVWASEIEEFPIAVTKKHFPEEVTNETD